MTLQKAKVGNHLSVVDELSEQIQESLCKRSAVHDFFEGICGPGICDASRPGTSGLNHQIGAPSRWMPQRSVRLMVRIYSWKAGHIISTNRDASERPDFGDTNKYDFRMKKILGLPNHKLNHRYFSKDTKQMSANFATPLHTNAFPAHGLRSEGPWGVAQGIVGVTAESRLYCASPNCAEKRSGDHYPACGFMLEGCTEGDWSRFHTAVGCIGPGQRCLLSQGRFFWGTFWQTQSTAMGAKYQNAGHNRMSGLGRSMGVNGNDCNMEDILQSDRHDGIKSQLPKYITTTEQGHKQAKGGKMGVF